MATSPDPSLPSRINLLGKKEDARPICLDKINHFYVKTLLKATGLLGICLKQRPPFL